MYDLINTDNFILIWYIMLTEVYRLHSKVFQIEISQRSSRKIMRIVAAVCKNTQVKMNINF